MASPWREPPRLKFGPFLVDPPAGKLLKAGIPIKLAPQPFKILLLLLESPGEVVTREAIQRHVWGDATFVDFDRGINFSINQIRAALCDDAEKPRYVETIPREGYRFIAELELADGAFAEHPRGTRNSAIHVVETTEHPNKETVTRRDRWRRIAFYGVPTFALAVVVVAVLLHTRGAPGITEKDTLVLGDFANRTGDPIFDETLKQALAIELDQSPFLNVLPDDAVRETLRYMGRSPDEKITPTIAREICERRGIKAMLTGSISNLGRNYVIALEARDCETGQPLAEQEIEAEGKEHLLRELATATSKLRSQLGESVRSIQKFDTPLELATTNSLEALQVYSLGQQRLAHGADIWDGVPFFKRAIALDPNFAMAYGALGNLYSGGGPMSNDDLSTEYLTKAFELRDRVSARERLSIAAAYYESVTRDLDKAVENYELWKATYPRDAQPYTELAGVLSEVGEYQSAAENAKQAIVLRPNHISGYHGLASAYLGLGRWSDAKAICKEAIARKLDGPRTHWTLYTLAFLEHDLQAMERELEWAKKTGEITRPTFYQALVLAHDGRLKQARGFFHQTIEERRSAHDLEGAALATIQLAVIDATLGYSKRGRAEALAIESDLRTDKDLVSLALALTGEHSRAQKLLTDVKNRFPQDTVLNYVHAPSVYAIIELNRGHPDQALELLKTSVPYELGADNRGWGLLPIYLRAQAHLQQKAGKDAAIEFQKITDHPGVARFSPLHALARLGLMRAYAIQGDSAKAQVAYQDFVTLWKGADPDLPILKQAKAEYTRLR